VGAANGRARNCETRSANRYHLNCLGLLLPSWHGNLFTHSKEPKNRGAS